MALLTRLERESVVSVRAEDLHSDPTLKSLVVYLLYEGYSNGLETFSVHPGVPSVHHSGRTTTELQVDLQRWGEVSGALRDQETRLRISHKGRVRRAELEQALRSGRDREPFGILWDARHLEPAVKMAVLRARPAAPVSVAYLDMNGLRKLNEEHGHAAADEAIKVYLQTLAMFVTEPAEGFRGGSADEVVVVMPGTALAGAKERMQLALRQLSKERVLVGGVEVAGALEACCGIATVLDPAADAMDLVKRADSEEGLAKKESKRVGGGSYLKVEGGEVERVDLAPATPSQAQ